MHARSAVALLVLLSLVGVVATTAPGTARAPPKAACGVCTDALDVAAAERGVDLRRGHTSLSVGVYANGSSRWVARVELVDGAEALGNDSRRRAVVAAARERVRTVADPRRVTSSVANGTLVVTYRDRVETETVLGVVRFGGFHATGTPPAVSGGEGPTYLGADAVVVRAPPGYGVAGDYPDAATNRTAVRWRSTGPDRTYVDAGVSFVRDGAWFPRVRATLADLFAGV